MIALVNSMLCMVVVFIEFYAFIPLSVTVDAFQGHRVKHLQLKKNQQKTPVCSYPIKWNLTTVVDYINQIMHRPLFLPPGELKGHK